MVHNATAQQVFFPYERNSCRNAYVQSGDQDITSVFLRLHDRSISKLPGGKELRRTNKRCLCSGDYQITVKSSIDISENHWRTKSADGKLDLHIRICGGHNRRWLRHFPTPLLPTFNNTKLPGPNCLSARSTPLTSSLSTITCPSGRTAAKAPLCLDSRPFTKRSYNSSWLSMFITRPFAPRQAVKAYQKQPSITTSGSRCASKHRT